MFAEPVKRGCGERQEGGCYFESGLSAIGSPIEDFLCDPPLMITSEMKAAMGIAPIGTSWFPEYKRELGEIVLDPQTHQPVVKTWHILDVIGQEHYPTVSQFVEEARRFGVSRRLAANLEWDRITRDTRLMAAYAKAFVPNTVDFEQWCCPKFNIMHKPIAIGRGYRALLVDDPQACSPVARVQQIFCCAGVWWEDEIGEPISQSTKDIITISMQDETQKDHQALVKYLLGDERAEWWDLFGGDLDRLITVKMPSLSFIARKRPEGIPEPRYEMAIFGRFPLGRIAVVKGEGSDRNLERASKASVLVEEVDQ